MFYFLVPILALLIAAACAFFIAAKVYRQLSKKRLDNWQVVLAATGAFITSFLVIAFGVLYIYVMAVPFER